MQQQPKQIIPYNKTVKSADIYKNPASFYTLLLQSFHIALILLVYIEYLTISFEINTSILLVDFFTLLGMSTSDISNTARPY